MLKKLTNVVNVVPVIAKSDALTVDERIAFKKRVITNCLIKILISARSVKNLVSMGFEHTHMIAKNQVMKKGL